jgi:L-aspartate oxidase
MHGANRLASNSLLEGLVVGSRAGRAAVRHAVEHGPAEAAAPPAVHTPAVPRPELQRAMTRAAGVVRDGQGLQRLSELLASAPAREMRDRSDLEDVALTVTASVVAAAASARDESRGCHHRADHPDADPTQAVSTHVQLDGAGRPVVALPAGVG